MPDTETRAENAGPMTHGPEGMGVPVGTPPGDLVGETSYDTASGGTGAASSASARERRTRLILLGTCGGPWVNRYRYASAQVILVDDVPYLVDCGYGTLLQLERAGIAYDSIRSVFITHHHSDHNADFGNLLVLSWARSLQSRVDAWGPPPLKQMTRSALEYFDYDIHIRMRDEGKPPLAPLVFAHEIEEPGLVMEDENVRVTAALADHPPLEPAFAFRFDTPDRSIVISGDTAPHEQVTQLAEGADVLVHEAMYLPAVFEQLAGTPVNADNLEKHMLNSHTTAEEAGRVASKAGVKTLVLSHLIPADDARFMVPDETWIKEAGAHFKGEILVGADLMEI